MHRTPKCLSCLLFLLSLLALTSASERQSNAGTSYHRVSNTDSLWRFKVGGGTKSLDIGDNYYCFLSDRTQFLASRDGRVYNDRSWCQTEERFVVKFIGEGLASVKRFLSNEYISCWNNGEARLSGDLGEWQKFRLEISDSDDRLTFYNPNRKRYLRAINDGSVRCDSENSQESSSMFFGWKTGKKEDWKPYDEGRLVTSLDNSGRTKSRTFEYKRTIGVKQVKGTAAGSRVRDPVRGGVGLKEIFTKYNSPTKTAWAEQNDFIWRDAKEKTGSVEVPAKTKARVYQIVGTYGPLEVHSEDFLVVEFPEEPQATNKFVVT